MGGTRKGGLNMARKLVAVRNGDSILCEICGREAKVYLEDETVYIDAHEECEHLRAIEYFLEGDHIELLIPCEQS
jgi:hypothetical protein